MAVAVAVEWCLSGSQVEMYKLILFHLRILSIDKNNFLSFLEYNP